MLDEVQAMGTAAMVNRTAGTGAGAGAGEPSEDEVAFEWLMALESSGGGGDLAAAAASLQAESREAQVHFESYPLNPESCTLHTGP
jgi:hypothetical protein